MTKYPFNPIFLYFFFIKKKHITYDVSPRYKSRRNKKKKRIKKRKICDI